MLLCFAVFYIWFVLKKKQNVDAYGSNLWQPASHGHAKSILTILPGDILCRLPPDMVQ